MAQEREPGLFENIVNSLPESLVVMDAGLRVAAANISFHRLCRTTPEETGKRPFFELAGGMWDAPRLRKTLRAVSSGRTGRAGCRITLDVPPAGTRILQVRAARLAAPGAPTENILLRIEDVTDRARAERELVETKNHLQAILDACEEIIFAKDTEGRYTLANVSFSRIFDLPQERIIGKKDDDLFPPDEAARIRAVDAEVIASGRRITTEDCLTVGREPRAFRATKVPLHDHAGRVVGLCGFAEDVTERKKLREREKEMERRLEQGERLEAVGRLAGGVAHDFNNMLSIILGNAQLLRGGLAPRSSLAGYAGEIIEAARRAADLTRQLLTFARRHPATPQVLDFNSFIAGQEKILRRLVREDIEMTFVPGEDLWNVKIDPGQAEQVLINLVINARDAIPGTGSIIIETANVTVTGEYTAFNAEAEPGEYVMTAVTDTGRGMDRDTASHVFEPFFTTKKESGTGLGLSTVHGIVKQNGGFINVYSEIGRGTTFKVYLPRAAAAAGDTPPPPPEAPPTPPGAKTVLIVEDEKQILAMCRTFLEQAGYTVLAASRPGEALRAAVEHDGDIHVLVTDIVMPDMDGRELESRIRKKHPDIRTLFMSGYTVNGVRHRGLLEEGERFLQKPFELSDLAAAISALADPGGGEAKKNNSS